MLKELEFLKRENRRSLQPLEFKLGVSRPMQPCSAGCKMVAQRGDVVDGTKFQLISWTERP